VLLVSVLGGWQQVSCDDYIASAKRLLNDLKLRDLSTDIRPVSDAKSAVTVSIQLHATSINYKESTKEFTTQGWFKMSWTDKQLSWSAEDYGNVTELRLSPGAFWLPDLTIYNTAPSHEHAKNAASPSKALVYSNGMVLYIPLVTWVTVCESNLLHWPYDTNTCKITLGSWTHPLKEIKMEMDDIPIDISNMAQTEWKVSKVGGVFENKKYDCCPDLYQSASLSFEIQRTSVARQATIITPAIVIAVLALLTCFIPPMSSSKLLVGVVQLLLICGQLIYLDSVFAESSGPAPMIASFYGYALVFVTISLIASVMTFGWMSFPKSSSPPESITKFLSGSIGRVLGVETQVFGYQLRDGEKNCETDQKCNIQKQWLALSNALHRMLFFVYCIVFVVLLSVYLS